MIETKNLLIVTSLKSCILFKKVFVFSIEQPKQRFKPITFSLSQVRNKKNVLILKYIIWNQSYTKQIWEFNKSIYVINNVERRTVIKKVDVISSFAGRAYSHPLPLKLIFFSFKNNGGRVFSFSCPCRGDTYSMEPYPKPFPNPEGNILFLT